MFCQNAPDFFFLGYYFRMGSNQRCAVPHTLQLSSSTALRGTLKLELSEQIQDTGGKTKRKHQERNKRKTSSPRSELRRLGIKVGMVNAARVECHPKLHIN